MIYILLGNHLSVLPFGNIAQIIHNLGFADVFSVVLSRDTLQTPGSPPNNRRLHRIVSVAHVTRHFLIECDMAVPCHLCWDLSVHIPVRSGLWKTEWMDSLCVSNEVVFQARVRGRELHTHTHTYS